MNHRIGSSMIPGGPCHFVPTVRFAVALWLCCVGGISLEYVFGVLWMLHSQCYRSTGSEFHDLSGKPASAANQGRAKCGPKTVDCLLLSLKSCLVVGRWLLLVVVVGWLVGCCGAGLPPITSNAGMKFGCGHTRFYFLRCSLTIDPSVPLLWLFLCSSFFYYSLYYNYYYRLTLHYVPQCSPTQRLVLKQLGFCKLWPLPCPLSSLEQELERIEAARSAARRF